jgi:sugar phosphate isomerase/epimerase
MTFTRRNLLQSSLAGMAIKALPASAAMDCYVQRLPAAQLFTARNAMMEDPGKALADLAANGVREIELYGLTAQNTIFNMPLAAFRDRVAEQGIAMTFAHIDGSEFDVPAIARSAEALGIETVILPVGPGFITFGETGLLATPPGNKDEMDGLVDLLNRLGKEFRREGFLFGYHNHHVEFMPVAGEIPFDYLMWNTDPQYVRCELDIGWLALAGVDYLAYLDRYGNRTLSCHLKDFNGKKPADPGDFLATASHLLPPGSGVVNFQAVLERMDYYNIRHGFVEIDNSPSPLEDINSGLTHLSSLRAC